MFTPFSIAICFSTALSVVSLFFGKNSFAASVDCQYEQQLLIDGLDSDGGGTQPLSDDGGSQKLSDDGGTCSDLSDEAASTSSDAVELLLDNLSEVTDGSVDCCCHFHFLVWLSSSTMMTLLGSCCADSC